MDKRSQVLSTVRLLHPIVKERTVICSPHELIAIVTHAHDVVVYRLNGQIAFAIKNPEGQYGTDVNEVELQVSCLEWSPDGRRLAVAWTNGSWMLHEAEKGEVVFENTVRDQQSDLDETFVSAFSWKRHDVDDSSLSKENIYPLQDRMIDNEKTAAVEPDLPWIVSSLDTTKVLPKLSALPAHGLRAGLEGSKFSSQASTDNVFAGSASSRYDKVETLLLHQSDGLTQVLLEGVSLVGTVKSVEGQKPGWTLYNAPGDTYVQIRQEKSSLLNVNTSHLPLTEMSSSIMHTLSSSTAQINALTLYVQRAVQCVIHDFTSGLSYPDRLLRSIAMTLEDNASSRATLATALQQLAMTGQFHADLLEWLADIVKDAGLKRWDTSISGMYSALQTHLHIHILPACDRLSIVASRLRGLARFHEGGEKFAADEGLFTTIIDEIDTLRLSSMRALQICIHEWSLWRSFARWMKMQVEVAAAGPGSKSAVETEDRESLGIDYGKVIQYVETVLKDGSRLSAFIKADTNASGKSSMPLSTASLRLHDAVESALQSITLWQARLFTAGQASQLQLGEAADIRDIVASSEGDENGQLLILILCLSQSTLSLRRRAIQIDKTKQKEAVQTHADTVIQDHVLDAKFCNQNKSILMLTSSVGDTSKYQLMKHDNTARESILIYTLNKDSGTPESIMVSGRAGKEFCIAFSKGNKTWQAVAVGNR